MQNIFDTFITEHYFPERITGSMAIHAEDWAQGQINMIHMMIHALNQKKDELYKFKKAVREEGIINVHWENLERQRMEQELVQKKSNETLTVEEQEELDSCLDVLKELEEKEKKPRTVIDVDEIIPTQRPPKKLAKKY